jgi:hypothetical protein
MKSVLFCVLGLLCFAFSCVAQISPTPVINNEIKDTSSIRMRSIELERVKREAEKASPDNSATGRQLKFSEIKNEFETIQKLQDSIIKTYTTGKTIDLAKISDLAAELNENSIRLDKNLFVAEKNEAANPKVDENIEQNTIPDLIVKLDKAIGNFVGSKIFQNSKLINLKESQETQSELKKIILLSDELSKEAKNRK